MQTGFGALALVNNKRCKYNQKNCEGKKTSHRQAEGANGLRIFIIKCGHIFS